MVSHVKMIYARMVVFVGLVGVVLTPILIVAVWRTQSQLSERTVEVIQFTKNVKTFADNRITQAKSVLKATRAKVDTLGQHTSRLSDDVEKNKDVVLTLRSLDHDIRDGLQEALDLANSIQMSLRSMGNTLVLFDSLPSFSSPSKSGDAPGLREMAQSLTETSDLLQQVIDHVERMQSGKRITQTELNELAELVARLKLKLQLASTWLLRLDGRTKETENRLLRLEARILQWSRLFAILLTPVLICFCFSQIHLIHYGQTLSRRSRFARAGKHRSE